MAHISRTHLWATCVCMLVWSAGGSVLAQSPGLVAADAPCPPVCLYESPGFSLTVVDTETGRPLADVFALAEWIQHGYHGHGGPIMVQDAVSGPDGLLTFPRWGPTRGSSAGLVVNQDPFLTLFKPGFKTVAMTNRVPTGTDEMTRVRRFAQDGHQVGMEPFRGTPEDWMAELRKARQGIAVSKSEEQVLTFRDAYMSLDKRLLAERQNAPAKYREPGQFFWHLQRDIDSMERGAR